VGFFKFMLSWGKTRVKKEENKKGVKEDEKLIMVE
jgi:hypothetical protein